MYFTPYWVTVKLITNVQVGTHLQILPFSYVCAKSQKLKGWPIGVNNMHALWCQKFCLYILWLQPPIAASRGRMKKLTYFTYITHPILLNSGDHCKRFATPLIVLYYSIFTSVYSSSCCIAIFHSQFIVLKTILWQMNTIRNFGPFGVGFDYQYPRFLPSTAKRYTWLTMPGRGSGESGGVMATYCFSTSAINREYEGLEIVSLTVVTKFPSESERVGTWTENSP